MKPSSENTSKGNVMVETPRAYPRLICSLICTTTVLILSQCQSFGFDNTLTHRLITSAAIRSSALEKTLAEELGLPLGAQTWLRMSAFDTKAVGEWLREGSYQEDRPNCRADNHFHNPLLPFDRAGVTDYSARYPLFSGACNVVYPEYATIHSSATWGARFLSPTQKGPGTGNGFDWDQAREMYLGSLILPEPEVREMELALTFRALGQVLHLVQDLAVPAHVRDDFDSHVMGPIRAGAPMWEWGHNDFEFFVQQNPALIQGIEPRDVPRIPILGRRLARFWDVDQYRPENPIPSMDLDQGLAEYTNANFLSLNTIFTETLPAGQRYRFPFPRQDSTNMPQVLAKQSPLWWVRAVDDRIDAVRCVAKVKDGETMPCLLKVGYLTDEIKANVPPEYSSAPEGKN